MKRWCSALGLMLALALPARAHFVWIVPDADGSGAKLVFSDALAPDDNVPITKIAQTDVFAEGADGRQTVTRAAAKDHYALVAPGKGARVLYGVCKYGVIQKGKAEPFLLTYSARALVGAPGTLPPAAFWRAHSALALDVVPLEGLARARVLWKGQPLAGAEVVLTVPGHEQPLESKTDKDGTFALAKVKGAGLYGIRARHVEAREGQEGEKKYKEARHYVTLVFPVTASVSKQAAAQDPVPKADPEATKLLRDARAARASWENFPGFAADLEYNHGGKVLKGKVEVSATGKVKVELADEAAKSWAQRQLRSLVDHRMGNASERDTPCAFADGNAEHPLGRAIRVLNDELHSSYRIRDRQIIEVNRQMKDVRFTITVLANQLTAEKKYLPSSFVVNSWNVATNALSSSAAFHHTWRRVGTFDLPETLLVVTATPGGSVPPASTTATPATATLDARSLRLSNLELSR